MSGFNFTLVIESVEVVDNIKMSIESLENLKKSLPIFTSIKIKYINDLKWYISYILEVEVTKILGLIKDGEEYKGVRIVIDKEYKDFLMPEDKIVAVNENYILHVW